VLPFDPTSLLRSCRLLALLHGLVLFLLGVRLVLGCVRLVLGRLRLGLCRLLFVLLLLPLFLHFGLRHSWRVRVRGCRGGGRLGCVGTRRLLSMRTQGGRDGQCCYRRSE
jgi:hypothetical protein